ncbi:MAG: hypothetical protein RBU30_00505 [Polyangia bacterium]|nr:hypothetical protein [Polyangia bacterium]
MARTDRQAQARNARQGRISLRTRSGEKRLAWVALGQAAFFFLFPLIVLVPSCEGSSEGGVKPRPKAGLEPVTLGELVQLRLAVEGFDTVFDARAEEQDLLPHLVHAWATFYHRPDPPPSSEARFGFTETLCRARLPKAGPPWSLLTCMDMLREALLEDLLSVTVAYRRAKGPDRVGEHRLSELEKDFKRRLETLRFMKKDRQERRAALALPTAERCDLEQPVVPLVAITSGGLLLNGFPVVTLPKGVESISPDELESFAGQLEGRLLEAPKGTTSSAQLIIAAHFMTNLGLLGRVLDRAAGLGVTRVCLKVERISPFRVPCCLPLRLGPPGVRPSRYLEPSRQGAFLKDGTSRTPLAFSALSSESASAPIRLAGEATVSDLVILCGRLWAATGRPPELIASGEASSKRTKP